MLIIYRVILVVSIKLYKNGYVSSHLSIVILVNFEGVSGVRFLHGAEVIIEEGGGFIWCYGHAFDKGVFVSGLVYKR